MGISDVKWFLKTKKAQQERLDWLKSQIVVEEQKFANAQYKTREAEATQKLKEAAFEKELALKKLGVENAITDLAKQHNDEIKKLQDQITKLTKEHEKQLKELSDAFSKEKIALTDKHKVERENDAITLKLDYKRQLAEAEAKAVEEFNKKYKSLLDENHTTLGDSLKKLHEEGNAQTKFVQELATTMLATKFSKTESEVKTIAMNS